MTQEGNLIKADEGMVFRRKGTEEIFGNEIYLGKSYYINGVLLDEPHDDIPDDFEEIPDPNPQPEEPEFLMSMLNESEQE